MSATPALHAPQIGLDPVRSPFGGATNVVSDGRYDDLDSNATANRAPRALRRNGRSRRARHGSGCFYGGYDAICSGSGG